MRRIADCSRIQLRVHKRSFKPVPGYLCQNHKLITRLRFLWSFTVAWYQLARTSLQRGSIYCAYTCYYNGLRCFGFHRRTLLGSV